MSSYEFLAGSYDELTKDVVYPQWADYIEKHFARSGAPIHTVLELACGTGSLTKELALRGYEMIGVDASEDMLAKAAEKCRDITPEPPIFLHQDMEKLDLYGTVDACICCLDSVNYVTKPQKLLRAFEQVYLFMEQGGLFLFDARMPARLREMDGQVFLDETEDTYCVWRAEDKPLRRICGFGMDVFRRDGDVWRRGEEYHEQLLYDPDELCRYMHAVGFQSIKQYGDRKLRQPKPTDERVFIVGRKEKKHDKRPDYTHARQRRAD
ncbi:MAG: methyltransferase domain-containing protein [Oscillospiraceae bacterium]|nr:methyltransferase domain-containing protein [Oscillospiraceae bacterium]